VIAKDLIEFLQWLLDQGYTLAREDEFGVLYWPNVPHEGLAVQYLSERNNHD